MQGYLSLPVQPIVTVFLREYISHAAIALNLCLGRIFEEKKTLYIRTMAFARGLMVWRPENGEEKYRQMSLFPPYIA